MRQLSHKKNEYNIIGLLRKPIDACQSVCVRSFVIYACRVIFFFSAFGKMPKMRSAISLILKKLNKQTGCDLVFEYRKHIMVELLNFIIKQNT